MQNHGMTSFSRNEKKLSLRSKKNLQIKPWKLGDII